MKNRVLSFLVLLLLSGVAHAQFGGGFSDVPIEIIADGETRFEGGVAIAEDNVSITYDDISIFTDYAQYNPDTRDVLLRGNVRIYRDEFVFVGERAVYNLETKVLRAADFSGDAEPFLFSAENVGTLAGSAYKVQNASLTTHDNADPHWKFKAKALRIYPDNRVIFRNVTLNIGRTPVLWLPYLYQSLDDELAFTIEPGYTSIWGAYVLTKFAFPISDNLNGAIRLDLRSDRGIAGGLDLNYAFGRDDRSWGAFQSYYAADSGTDINGSDLPREVIDEGRYRVSYQSRTYFTEDIYANTDINVLSDSLVLEDFFRSEFVTNPQPDNNISLVKWDENYTLTALFRAQVNDFQPTTERLPEVVLDIKRQQLFNSPLFYAGETGIAALGRDPGDSDVEFADYDSLRFDTLHQVYLPKTFGGWLSVVPRLGMRGTYYNDSGSIETQSMLLEDGTTEEFQELISGGSKTRFSVLAGVEASFKLWKNYDNVQSRRLGLDGLRHVFQPYTNFSYVSDPGVDADDILQFDEYIPGTEIPPIDMDQFTAIDGIDKWTIWRFGMRNRWQTERDGSTFNWLEMDTFFDVNIENPYDDTDFSNLVNSLTWRPLPWLNLSNDFQAPIFDDGFTQINSRARFMVHRSLELEFGHRFLSDSDFFQDSNLVTYGGYWRANENWGFSMRHQYEFEDGVLESQRYLVHRDLTSWVASFGAILRDNGGGEDDFGFLLTFTLKDFPQLSLPLNLDPQAGGED